MTNCETESAKIKGNESKQKKISQTWQGTFLDSETSTEDADEILVCWKKLRFLEVPYKPIRQVNSKILRPLTWRWWNWQHDGWVYAWARLTSYYHVNSVYLVIYRISRTSAFFSLEYDAEPTKKPNILYFLWLVAPKIKLKYKAFHRQKKNQWFMLVSSHYINPANDWCVWPFRRKQEKLNIFHWTFGKNNNLISELSISNYTDDVWS